MWVHWARRAVLSVGGGSIVQLTSNWQSMHLVHWWADLCRFHCHRSRLISFSLPFSLFLSVLHSVFLIGGHRTSQDPSRTQLLSFSFDQILSFSLSSSRPQQLQRPSTPARRQKHLFPLLFQVLVSYYHLLHWKWCSSSRPRKWTLFLALKPIYFFFFFLFSLVFDVFLQLFLHAFCHLPPPLTTDHFCLLFSSYQISHWDQ